MIGWKGRSRGGSSLLRVLLVGFCMGPFFAVFPLSVEAEIVQRDLGKNSKGETVSGYVFQPGRSYRRRARTSDSVFGGRAERYRRGHGIDNGYQYPFYASSFYYYVPYSYSYPIHRYHGGGGGRLSVHLRF